MKYKAVIFLVLTILMMSCGGEAVFLPKPRLFPKINFPEKKYQDFDENYCSFSFRFPAYANVKQDENFFDEKPAHPCWFDVQIPSLNGKLHCSYYPINGRKELDKFVTDAYNLAGKHNLKAEFYEESVLNYPGRVKGVLFEIHGDVATPVQFFLTDSSNHFFRASLYFNNQVNVDSMEPVYDFIKQDIDTLLSSFYWK